TTAANTAFNALPKTLTIDWRAIMLNGNSWWNSGGTLMLFSGGNTDAPGAALHEGGHGFQQLADEYGTCTGASCGTNTMGSGTTGQVNPEVNSCANPATTDNKWTMWVGYNQTGATGVQGTFDGSRYIAIGAGQYRPSANSMMNSLFCGNGGNANCTANTAYNSVSREETVMAIWKRIKPIDSTDPAAGAVTSPGILKVNVIDPVVISVDWTIDGTTMTNAGVMFDTSTLAAGSHTISAKAYDNAGDDLVRVKTSMCPSSVTGNYCHYNAWKNSIQTVTWTFTK
ncbi:MAG TPA: M64 family metallopeptidase, partial [Polyangia bacterium]